MNGPGGLEDELELVPVQTSEAVSVVARLASEIWLEHYPAIVGLEQTRFMVERLQTADPIATAIARGTRYFLLRVTERDLGYAAVERVRDHLFLSKLYLLRDARGRGLGSAALEAITRLARADGLSRIELTVNRNNELALRCYTRFGMTIEGTRVTDLGGGYVMDDYVLGLRLSAS